MFSHMSLRNKLILSITLLMVVVMGGVYLYERGVVANILLHQDVRSLRSYALLMENTLSIDNDTISVDHIDNHSIHGGYGVVLFSNDGKVLLSASKYPSQLISYPFDFNSKGRQEAIMEATEEDKALRMNNRWSDEAKNRKFDDKIHTHDDKYLVYDKNIIFDGQDYILRVSKSIRLQLIAIEQISISMLIITVLSTCIMIFAIVTITRRPLSNISKISEIAAILGKGDLTTRITDITSNDEIGTLAKNFNDMADNLYSAFEREKQFTSDVSHELRTPLAVIISNAEYAEKTDEIETYKRSNKEVIAKARQLQTLITQLLGLAREMEQVNMLELHLMDISMILEDIADEYIELANLRNITINTNIAKGLRLKIDLMLFTRLVCNLFDNAIKYNKDNGKIIITAYSKDDNIVIDIVDTGIGVSADDLPHIFERLYRVDKSRTDKSMGLGLSFVEMIARLHKGSVSVESEQDKGSIFTVTLPISRDS